jgi:hypothetical protein
VIALVAAARPGRGGTETYYTVPWCPRLEQHSLPQMPGAVWSHIQKLLGIFRKHGIDARRLRDIDRRLLSAALLDTGDVLGVIIFEGARLLMLELEIVPS